MKVFCLLAVLCLIAVQVEACKDGASWDNGCNLCKCVNGKEACGRKACQFAYCKPKTSWSDGCNRCFCLTDGKEAGCTKIMCDTIPVIKGVHWSGKVSTKADPLGGRGFSNPLASLAFFKPRTHGQFFRNYFLLPLCTGHFRQFFLVKIGFWKDRLPKLLKEHDEEK